MKESIIGLGLAALVLAGCASTDDSSQEEAGEEQGVHVTSVTLNPDGTQTVRSIVWTQEQALQAIAERDAAEARAAGRSVGEEPVAEAAQAISVDAGCSPSSLWISDSTSFSGPGVSLLCYNGAGWAPIPADWNGSASAPHRPRAILTGALSGYFGCTRPTAPDVCRRDFKGSLEAGSRQQLSPLWSNSYDQEYVVYDSVSLSPDRNPVHRAFGYGHHFYTLNADEVYAAGLTMEGRNYFDLSGSHRDGTVELYRCNLNGFGHLYTTSAYCEGNPSTFEGHMGYIATTQLPGTVPLYRLYRPGGNGDHLYTLSLTEVLNAIGGGWVYEGIVGYVWNHI